MTPHRSYLVIRREKLLTETKYRVKVETGDKSFERPERVRVIDVSKGIRRRFRQVKTPGFKEISLTYL